MARFGTFLCAAASALTFGGVAHATIYHLVGQDIAPATATGTITTDGTIGVLTQANITATDIIISDSTGSAVLDGEVDIAGSDLTATSSGIYFNYNGVGDADYFGVFNIAQTSAYCIATGAYPCITNLNDESIEIGPDIYQGPTQSGEVEIAAVPELSTWALMLAGFGLAGAAMRTRRSVAA